MSKMKKFVSSKEMVTKMCSHIENYEPLTKLLGIVLYYDIINDQKEECDRDACIKLQLCVQW